MNAPSDELLCYYSAGVTEGQFTQVINASFTKQIPVSDACGMHSIQG